MTDSLTLLLADMKRESLLIPHEEQRALARRYRATGCPEAKDRLVRSILRLVVFHAKRYRGVAGGLSLADLVSAGTIGAIRAVERYDPSTGFALSTLATHWIRQGITREIDNVSRTVRVPVHRAGEIRKYAAVLHKLTQQLGCVPAVEDIAKAGGWTHEQVAELRQLSHRPRSLEERIITEDGPELHELIPDDTDRLPQPFESAAEVDVGERLRGALQDLPYRSRRVLELRFGLADDRPWTLDRVAAHFNMTRERARLIQEEALTALRDGRHADALGAAA